MTDKKTKKQNIKHCVTARDKKTGEIRMFIFEGYLSENGLIVEEVITHKKDDHK